MLAGNHTLPLYSRSCSVHRSQLNIAEGYALMSRRRFRNHLEIAYGSAVETKELLEILTVNNLLPSDLGSDAVQRCSHAQQLLLGLIRRYRDPGP